VPQLIVQLQHPGMRGLIEDDGGRITSSARLDEILEEWQKDKHGLTSVIEADGLVAGHVRMGWWWDALTPWLDVVVDPAHRRRGLGAEAARRSLAYLFGSTPAHVVHASTPDWNLSGVHFAEHLGFERAGALRRTGIRDGRYVDTIQFELMRSRWEQVHATRR
jgi:RimJ/RimL family protein N-acetyltransferase